MLCNCFLSIASFHALLRVSIRYYLFLSSASFHLLQICILYHYFLFFTSFRTLLYISVLSSKFPHFVNFYSLQASMLCDYYPSLAVFICCNYSLFSASFHILRRVSVLCRFPNFAVICRSLQVTVLCKFPNFAVICRFLPVSVLCRFPNFTVICCSLQVSVLCNKFPYFLGFILCYNLPFSTNFYTLL